MRTLNANCLGGRTALGSRNKVAILIRVSSFCRKYQWANAEQCMQPYLQILLPYGNITVESDPTPTLNALQQCVICLETQFTCPDASRNTILAYVHSLYSVSTSQHIFTPPLIMRVQF